VRIFRDESSLAANPHLWSSITEALESSGWFVLLLSPDAADSEWVGKEIEHWIANKPADRILPVVTDGDFAWQNGDVAGSSVPSALHGVLTEEPRWVDLRFAKGDENLDLQNPDFSAAVADIASTIRGIPKDELAGEEVRQHRRTVRTAWAAGIAVTVLAIASIVAGGFAVGQRNDARTSAALAQTEAERANTLAEQEAAARADAQANAEAEAQARKLADASARLATARELAASAVNVLADDPELAILLTLEAIKTTPDGIDQPVEVIDALWRAVQEDRLTRVIDTGSVGFVWVGLSSDGSLLVASSENDSTVRLYSLPDDREIWAYHEETTDSFAYPFISPDGNTVAVGVWDSTAMIAVRDLEPDQLPARVMILEASTGTLLQTLEFDDCPSAMAWGWSPGGSYFAISHGVGPCDRPGATDGSWIEILDGQTFERVAFIDPLESEAALPAFDAAENLYVFSVSEQFGLAVYEPPRFDLARTIDGIQSGSAISSDGSIAVTFSTSSSNFLAAYDTATGDRTDLLRPVTAFPRFPTPFGFVGSDHKVILATEGSDTLVWDLDTGEQVLALRGGPGTNAVASQDGSWLYTGHTDGTIKVWTMGPGGGLTSVGDLGSYEYINGNGFAVGPTIGSAVAIDLGAFEFEVVFFDQSTGAFVGDSLKGAGFSRALADDRFVVDVSREWGIYDPVTGRQTYLGGCTVDRLRGGDVCIDTGEPAPEFFPYVSADGTEIANLVGSDFQLFSLTDGSMVDELTISELETIYAFTSEWILGDADGQRVVFDRDTGAELVRIDDQNARDVTWGRTEVSRDGTLVVAWADSGDLSVVDPATWDSRSIPLQLGRVRGLAIGPGETKVALGDENGLHIIDLTTNSLEQSIPLPSVSDMHWIDEDTVLIGTTNGV
ncbi:MAG: TIR domain-containing protein, partial [Acidimicrobiia bacterium]|nr:TIR domain-containing protein [Acidimicrobiia bacterium]